MRCECCNCGTRLHTSDPLVTPRPIHAVGFWVTVPGDGIDLYARIWREVITDWETSCDDSSDISIMLPCIATVQ